MKKTYINPEMEIFKLQNRQYLLAGSETIDKDDTPIGNSGDVGARRFNGFFEDDEEE